MDEFFVYLKGRFVSNVQNVSNMRLYTIKRERERCGRDLFVYK